MRNNFIRSLLIISSLIIAASSISSAANKVTGLAVSDYGDYTSVLINLKKAVKFQVKMAKGNKLYVIVPNSGIDKNVSPVSGNGAVKKVYTTTKDGDAYVIVELNSNAKKYTGKATESPAQIQIKIIKKSFGTSGDTNGTNDEVDVIKKGNLKMPGVKKGCDANLDTNFPTSASEMTPDKTPTIVDTIVIDPGHGGRFSGTDGFDKSILEKDINLGISLRLARMLRDELGVRVALTRVDDSHVYMKDRTGLANDVKADIFIDIHNNGVLSSKANGTETFFLSTDRADWDRAASIAENEEFYIEDPAMGKANDTISMILAAMAQNEYLEYSKDLAHYVQEEIVDELGTRDRGVKQMPLYVLVYADMPAILIEYGFMTNAKEEAMLLDPKKQEDMARATFRAIKLYKENYEAKVNR